MDYKEVIRAGVQGRLGLLNLMRSEPNGFAVAAELSGFRRVRSPFGSLGVELMRNYMIGHLEDASTLIFNEEESDEVINSYPAYPSTIAHADEITLPTGFAYFAKEIPDPVGTEPLRPLTALSWSVSKHQEAIKTLMDYDDEKEGAYVLTIVGYSQPKYIWSKEIAEKFSYPLYPMAFVTWAIGVDGGGTLMREATIAELRDDRAVFVKILLAFFALLHSDVLEAKPQETKVVGASNLLKHAAKKKKQFNQDILVVKYKPRPTKGPSKQYRKTDRKVGVRYRKAPFWKWVWYPSINDHRLRRIKSYWSGPEDAPKVGYERVFIPAGDPKPKPTTRPGERTAEEE